MMSLGPWPGPGAGFGEHKQFRCSFFWLFVDQHILLPFAGFFIGTVNAAHPAAWAFLTFEKLFQGTFDAP